MEAERSSQQLVRFGGARRVLGMTPKEAHGVLYGADRPPMYDIAGQDRWLVSELIEWVHAHTRHAVSVTGAARRGPQGRAA